MFHPVAGEKKLESPCYPSRRRLGRWKSVCDKLPRDPNMATKDHTGEQVAFSAAPTRSGEVLEYQPYPAKKGGSYISTRGNPEQKSEGKKRMMKISSSIGGV